jgi:hypothetical protein
MEEGSGSGLGGQIVFAALDQATWNEWEAGILLSVVCFYGWGGRLIALLCLGVYGDGNGMGWDGVSDLHAWKSWPFVCVCVCVYDSKQMVSRERGL